MLTMDLIKKILFKMIHTVKIKKITQLFNVYEYIPNNLDTPITALEIDKAIRKFEIFKQDKPILSRSEHIKQIAYLVNNIDMTPICIDIGNPETGKVPDNILTSGFHHLAAAVYRKDSDILVDLNGSAKALSSLFNITEIKEEDIFDWTANDNKLNSRWSDEAFVLTQILNRTPNVVKLADPKIWNEKFLNEIFPLISTKDFIEEINKENRNLLFSADFVKAFSKQIKLFKIVWDDHYKYLFKKEDYSSSPILTFKGKAETKKSIFESIFSNKENCLKLLELNNDFYRYFSKKIKLDKDIISEVHKKNLDTYSFNTFNLGEFLPPEYFNDFHNNIYYIKNFYKEKGDPIFELATKNWINDKDKCIEMFNSFKDEASSSSKYYLYNELAPSLKKDKDFNLKIVKNNPIFYNYMPDILKKDIDVIETICSSLEITDNHAFPNIPFECYGLIKNESIIKKIIFNHPHLLQKEYFPKEWTMKKEYLITIGNKIDNLEFKNISDYKSYLDDEELIVKLISNNYKFFDKLPVKYKKNKTYVLEALSSNFDKSTCNLKKIPHELWLDKDFCIEAFKITDLSIKHIPTHFFNQKDFILEFFKEVTKNNSDFVKSHLPTEISKFLSNLNVNGDYHSYFERTILSQSLELKLGIKDKTSRTIKI